MFISQAFAQAADAAAPADGTSALIMNVAPILIIFVIFYFLVIRPQSKKIKAHQETMNHLKAGDSVVTGGGFLATVVSVDGDVITLDLGNKQIVRALKHTLGGLQTPVSAQDIKPKTGL